MSVFLPGLTSTNDGYRAIRLPYADRAKITRGIFRSPGPDPLTPSNTSFAVNANPATGGPLFESSAEVIDDINKNNTIAEEARLSEESALEEISEPEETEETQITEEIFTTEETQIAEEEPIEQKVTTTRFESDINIFLREEDKRLEAIREENNLQEKAQTIFKTTTSPFERPITLTGAETTITPEVSVNFAAVNAKLNVNISPEANTHIQALQNLVASEAFREMNLFHNVDGMIPMAAATLADFSGPLNQNATRAGFVERIISKMLKLRNSRTYAGEPEKMV